jgi:hypothetical protein
MTTAILDVRRVARPGVNRAQAAAPTFASVFASDRLHAGQHLLVCRWRRDVDGRLACIWEPDIATVRQHSFRQRQGLFANGR